MSNYRPKDPSSWVRELKRWAILLLVAFSTIVLFVVLPKFPSWGDGSAPTQQSDDEGSTLMGLLIIGPLIAFAVMVMIGIGRARSTDHHARKRFVIRL